LKEKGREKGKHNDPTAICQFGTFIFISTAIMFFLPHWMMMQTIIIMMMTLLLSLPFSFWGVRRCRNLRHQISQRSYLPLTKWLSRTFPSTCLTSLKESQGLS
jgi:hypothetical protein